MERIIDALTVPEVAKYLKVNEETIRRNIRAKRLRASKMGTQWFVSREDLALFAGNYDTRTGKIRSLFKKNLSESLRIL